MARIQEGEASQMPVVIKSDVHGSLEAITTSLKKLGTDEVEVNILHTGVGGINESDVTLAQATNAVVIGFNVRANPQARELAKRDGVDIRYYSIIYNVVDDVKAALSGMLSPIQKENFLGLRRDPRGVQHHQGRQGGRVHDHRRLGPGAARKCACCATTS